MGGFERWAGWVADVNDLQSAGVVGDEGGLAIGGKSDVIGRARGVEVAPKCWVGRITDVDDVQAVTGIGDEGGAAIGRDHDSLSVI
ncbi:hypothetical protein MITS9509_01289 [Synechococcus sp. MIT S9509]|nr:hypothetical protein MITS9509_01289 [Synechococcus sp. MIT S9509]